MRFENQTFTKDVSLDCNEFSGCTIRDCSVYFDGGNFSLRNTNFINVRIVFGGAAKNTLALVCIARASGASIDGFLSQATQPDARPLPATTAH